jgi:hypothetical protein
VVDRVRHSGARGPAGAVEQQPAAVMHEVEERPHVAHAPAEEVVTSPPPEEARDVAVQVNWAA